MIPVTLKMFPKSDYRLLLQFLLAAIATGGCTQTQPDIVSPSPQSATPTQAPTSSVESNPFNSVRFPQESCGDSLPEDGSAYPVSFYPVFVDYSEKNLQILQSQFCKDSIKVFRDNKNKNSIQVASFTSQEKAEQFRKFIFPKIGMGELGQPTTLTQKPNSTQGDSNLLNNEIYPKKNCGDKLPSELTAYPLKLYPVFIENNERNRDSIQSKFCQNAFVNYPSFLGDSIEVASFLSEERAKKFKNLMQREVGSGEIGEPIIRESLSLEKTQVQTKEEIGRAAGLTSAQIEQLVSLAESNQVPIKGSPGQNREMVKVKAIVPTYLPRGFNVEQVVINKSEWGKPKYIIKYRDSQDRCFEVLDYPLLGDSPIMHEQIGLIYSQTLGYVHLGYTQQYRLHRGTVVSSLPIPIDRNGQVMKSGSNKQHAYNFALYSATDQKTNCNAISMTEAIKIIESLQYLNP
jgi:hypothetical protein